MPEAKLLFGIAAVVILGLVGWVIAVLRGPRETWARDHVLPAPPSATEPPLVADEPAAPSREDREDEERGAG